MKIDISNNSYKQDLELMEHIPREAYIEIYRIIGENMWDSCSVPTVGDIADFMGGRENRVFDDVTDFLGNKDKLESLLSKTEAKYSNEESEVFIKKVISSNVTDISESGWFYKKLMASTDDIRIIEEDCGSSGVTIPVEDLNKEIYDFKIRFSYVEEIEDYATMPYENFMQEVIDFENVTVRSPLTCNNAKERKLCKKCSGVVRKSHDGVYSPENFGIFSTLMVTEHATQASLDSMNKGLSENINKLLDKKFTSRKMSWEDVQKEITSIVDQIGDVGVQARFYEVVLLSRIFNKGEYYTSSSFQYSITHQNDALGAYIFSNTPKNLIKLVNKDEFEADSIKTKIMFDIYD